MPAWLLSAILFLQSLTRFAFVRALVEAFSSAKAVAIVGLLLTLVGIACESMALVILGLGMIFWIASAFPARPTS